MERSRKLDVQDSKPKDLTRGRDWLNFGYKPGIDIGKLIRLSSDLRDDKNFSKEMVFQCVEGITNSKQAVERLVYVLES